MKNRIVIVLSLLLVFFLPVFALAQVETERSKEITRIGGKDYYLHHVKQGETLYGLSKLYNVTEVQITTMNPEISNGLQAGMVLGIPVVNEKPKPVAPMSNDNTQHLVVKGETIYGISRKYGVTEQELKAMNPGIEDGLREGQTLVIPKKTPATPSVPSEPVVPQKLEITHESSQDQPSGVYVVKKGETLFDIAKRFGIDIKHIKAVNPGLDNAPRAGVSITIPQMVNNENYLIHEVEHSQRTKALLRLWKVEEESFRVLNPFVGSRVFSGQNVLIPIRPVNPDDLPHPVVIVPEKPTPELPEEDIHEAQIVFADCDVLAENSQRLMHVALLIPLYLKDVDHIVVSKDAAARSQKSRPFSFIQYYEGFMMAVDSLTNHAGLRLDLTVIDVDENVNNAHAAVSKLQNKNIDLIIGPFFSKSFSVVEEYAKANSIVIVNPLSERDNVVKNNPNVVKLRPNQKSQMAQLGNLIRRHYPDSKVTIFYKQDANKESIDELERVLNLSINTEVGVSNADFLNYVAQESRRREMGERLLQTVEVEGQVYATGDINNRLNDSVILQNRVDRYIYSDENLDAFRNQLSGVRDNVVVVYGTSIVFATQVLNYINKIGNRYPVTLIGLPDWAKFDNLIVENLMTLNAIYFDDHFIDHSTPSVNRFVSKFRNKYGCDPKDYAFEGYDVGLYFLTALMRYGNHFGDCLPNYHIPLLHTNYYFTKSNAEDGLENYFWSIYQYDNELIKLAPINSNHYINE